MSTTYLSILSADCHELDNVKDIILRSNLDLGYTGSKNVELKDFIREQLSYKHILFLRPSKNFMTISSPENLKKLGDVDVVVLGKEIPTDLIGFLQEYKIAGFVNPSDLNESNIQEILKEIADKGYLANEHIPLEYWINKRPHVFPRPKPVFTPGEEQVLQLLCHNFNVKEICEELDKNEPAVRAQIINLRQKLYAKSLLEIVVIAMANMWIKIDPNLTASKSPYL